MRALVTGGAGFIGSHLASTLAARGDYVRIVDNFSTGREGNIEHLLGSIDVVNGDLTDSDQAKMAVDNIDVVYHLAALASVPRSVARPFDTHAACSTATLNLLEAARNAGVKRFIYAGSSSVYGNQPFSSKRETDLPAPLSPYAAAKHSGELYCSAFFASYGLETVVIRYFNVFGPRQDPESEYAAVIPKFVTDMLNGEAPTIFGDGTQSRDFTYVENVVRANLAAANAPDASGKCFNVACGKQFTLIQLVNLINDILGTAIKPRFAPARPGDVHESLADITAARRVLGYEPSIDFKEGLERSIEYYSSLVSS